MSLPTLEDSNNVAVIAPGPAIRGIAKGKTAIFFMCSGVIVVFSVDDLRSCRRSNNISNAVQKSKKPPEILKAGNDIESLTSNHSPTIANIPNMKNAIAQARNAVSRRC